MYRGVFKSETNSIYLGILCGGRGCAWVLIRECPSFCGTRCRPGGHLGDRSLTALTTEAPPQLTTMTTVTGFSLSYYTPRQTCPQPGHFFFAKGKKTPIMHMVKELQFQRQGCDLRRKNKRKLWGRGRRILELGILVTLPLSRFLDIMPLLWLCY